jgi:hypothetical protein
MDPGPLSRYRLTSAFPARDHLAHAAMFLRLRTSETFFIGRAFRPRREEARAALAQLLEEEGGARRLETALGDELPAGKIDTMSEDELVEKLADGVSAGRYLLVGLRPRPAWAPELAPLDAPAGAEQDAHDEQVQEAQEKSWIEITIVNLHTGVPVNGVPLLITPASGSEAEHKSNEQGVVRVDGISKGPCVVRCKLGEVTRSDALIFMGSGGGAPPRGGSSGGTSAKRGKVPSIVAVERHKVRTGETLDGLAKSIGSTWQKVARFNWGTDEPNKVNRSLRTVVGSTKKARDGKNYIFDDGDKPGIVLLPREWRAEGMETGHAYMIEVVPAAAARPWLFSL